MVMRSTPIKEARLASDAGIAIGPILFIIAVLGILAAAIAAGSGSFTAGTSTESNRAKAAALIDIGQNLKIGFDRILGMGVEFGEVIIDADQTTDAKDLFSPLGGGIVAPSTTMAADTTTAAKDAWQYPTLTIPKLGTNNHSRTALLRVTKGVCDDINLKVAALPADSVDADVDLGDFSTVYTTPLAVPAWPTDLQGKTVGCVKNTNDDTIAAGYYFYQVLGVE